MLLVVDANIVFSALIREGVTLRLFEFNSIFEIFELVAPEFIWEEIEEHKEEIIRKSKLSEGELEKVLKFVRSEIKPMPEEYFSEFLEEAKEISPEEDFPYVALALKLKSLGLEVKIWSNDKELKKALEGRIEVLSTKEILERLRIKP